MAKSLHVLSLALLVAGGLNWGLTGALRFDAVRWLVGPGPARAVYVLVGLAAAYHLFRRDFYLPFLGPAVHPCGSLRPRTPLGADVEVVIRTKPNALVVYWAAEPGRGVAADPWIAYATGSNSGVTRADSDGRAFLRFRRPGAYKVPSGRTLKPHVHYRTCVDEAGMLSRVSTAFLC